MLLLPRIQVAPLGPLRSLRRALDRRVYLLLKGKDGKWTFPQTERNEGEIMRAAAKRSLEEFVGTGAPPAPSPRPIEISWQNSCPVLQGRECCMCGSFVAESDVLHPTRPSPELNILSVGFCPIAHSDGISSPPPLIYVFVSNVPCPDDPFLV